MLAAERSHRLSRLLPAGALALTLATTLAIAPGSSGRVGASTTPRLLAGHDVVTVSIMSTVPVGDGSSLLASPAPPSSAKPTSTTSRASTALPLVVPSGNGRTIYLTFDDGPDPTWTPRIMTVLKRYHVTATFFAIGYNVDDHPALVRAEHAAGFAVENHTQQHVNLARYPFATMLSAQILPAARAIRAQTGVYPMCVRPPYGAFDTGVRSALGSLGMRMVLWTIDTNDWKQSGAVALERSVLGGVRAGSVILMHDGGGKRSQTVAALAYLLPRLIAAHWHFGRVCQ